MILLDTSVLIPIRDKDLDIVAAMANITGPYSVSVISVVELEGGVNRKPHLAGFRRDRLDAMLDAMTILPFTPADAATYGRIVASAGYSRRKLLDRMIAAQALSARAVLVTLNPQDFEDVEGLTVRAL